MLSISVCVFRLRLWFVDRYQSSISMMQYSIALVFYVALQSVFPTLAFLSSKNVLFAKFRHISASASSFQSLQSSSEDVSNRSLKTIGKRLNIFLFRKWFLIDKISLVLVDEDTVQHYLNRFTAEMWDSSIMQVASKLESSLSKQATPYKKVDILRTLVFLSVNKSQNFRLPPTNQAVNIIRY